MAGDDNITDARRRIAARRLAKRDMRTLGHSELPLNGSPSNAGRDQERMSRTMDWFEKEGERGSKKTREPRILRDIERRLQEHPEAVDIGPHLALNLRKRQLIMDRIANSPGNPETVKAMIERTKREGLEQLAAQRASPTPAPAAPPSSFDHMRAPELPKPRAAPPARGMKLGAKAGLAGVAGLGVALAAYLAHRRKGRDDAEL